MTENNDTICAIATAPGVGGIAVIRISGHKAIEITGSIWKGKKLAEAATHTAHLGNIIDRETNEVLDQGIATVFRAPASFTGEDTVELSVHGSQWIQAQTINLLIRNGCRLAQAGEFTRRAFASGKMDLTEAEAVADVIAATSRASHRVAMSQMRGQFSQRLSTLRTQMLELASLLELELDFSEEDVEFADRKRLLDIANDTLSEVTRLAESFATGDAIRRGVPVAIIGRPNVGKSSILNQLLNDSRAIVSDIPGTTRDTIEDTTDIGGTVFRFIDTAGLRTTSDPVENLGIQRAWEKIADARIILWVITPDELSETASFLPALTTHKHPDAKIIPVINKTDLYPSHTATGIPDITAHPNVSSPLGISAKTGQGLQELRQSLIAASGTDTTTGDIIITNARHYEALTAAADSLRRAISGLTTTLAADLIAQDIRETIHHLSSITGAITTPDILATIFSRFCIGK